MHAVIKTGGKQYRVSAGDEIEIERLDAEPGDTVQFNDVLMLSGKIVTIGAPTVEGAAVQAEVVGNIRGPKVYNFKRRRRKHSSKRLKGHRQDLTAVRIVDILAEGAGASGVKAAIGSGQAAREARAAERAGGAAPAE